jgi:hypothetical protein
VHSAAKREKLASLTLPTLPTLLALTQVTQVAQVYPRLNKMQSVIACRFATQFIYFLIGYPMLHGQQKS